jgi:hypothetical protein
MATFGDVWRKVRLECPLAGPLLLQTWSQDVYNVLTDRRPWAFLRKEATLTTLASRSLTVGVTQASTAVTSAALFVASDAGRQIRIGTTPSIYTIATFTDASNVVLERVYDEDDDAAATATIQDIYAVMPADFGQFLVVANPAIERPLIFWLTQEELIRYDPHRSNTDSTPRALVARDVSTVTATLGQLRYEWWPHPTSAATFPYLYIARPAALSDTTNLDGVLRHRDDILRYGVLARAARWPGPPGGPKNPYFNRLIADDYETKFEAEMLKLDLRDDEQALMSVDNYPWHAWSAWLTTRDDTFLPMPFRSPWKNPVVSMPDSGGNHRGKRGGELGPGETANSVSGLAKQPSIWDLGRGDPGQGGTVTIPDLTPEAGRTIDGSKSK